ncbi:MAG: hypothetical protein EXR53_04815 [Dehalococcoidia bacterium]|nr:hypothetical protein [Dehalococcoidia bacterium]
MVQTTEPGKPGINGGLFKQMGPDDKPRSYIGVASVARTLNKVKARGDKVVQPKMAIPGMGWFAFIVDPEGNLQGIFQDDSKAK